MLFELVKLSMVSGREETSQERGEGWVAYGGEWELEWRGVRALGCGVMGCGAAAGG